MTKLVFSEIYFVVEKMYMLSDGKIGQGNRDIPQLVPMNGIHCFAENHAQNVPIVIICNSQIQ